MYRSATPSSRVDWAWWDDCARTIPLHTVDPPLTAQQLLAATSTDAELPEGSFVLANESLRVSPEEAAGIARSRAHVLRGLLEGLASVSKEAALLIVASSMEEK